MKIENSNKLIAEFMGCIESKGMLKFPFSFPIKVRRCKGGLHLPYSWLKFDSDWNWLMPVVEKIQMLEEIFDFSIGSSYTCIEHVNQNYKWNMVFYKNELHIYKTFLLIVEFIEWYNKKHKII